MKQKKKEFLALKQGGMSVTEYRDKFINLSCYAPEDVADDGKKQELFMDGLAGPLQYQLMSHTFPSFQKLVDNAITLEYKCRELGELKRKATTPGQSGSITSLILLHSRGRHFDLEARVVILDKISSSATFSRSSTPFNNSNSPLHRPRAPMTRKLDRALLQELQ